MILLLLLLRRESEPDLGGGGLDGDAVPADSALAHLVDVVPQDGVLGLVGDVPRQSPDEDQRHDGRCRHQNESPAEASPGGAPVPLHYRDRRHVDRRQVPNNRIGHGHRRAVPETSVGGQDVVEIWVGST